MKPTTIEAFSRLVTMYVTVIEATGATVPADIVCKLGTDPVKACEQLNELALSCGALTREIDAAIAAVYESMDAADARSAVTDELRLALEAAYAASHREPEPEPEPEPEQPAEAPEADTSAEQAELASANAEQGAAEATPEQEAKPKRRTRKTRTKVADAKAPADDAEAKQTGDEQVANGGAPEQGNTQAPAETPAEPAVQAPEETADAPEVGAPAPAATEAAVPEAATPETAFGPEPAPTPSTIEAPATKSAAAEQPVETPAQDAPAATAEPSVDAPAAPTIGTPFEGEVLTVDQTLAALGLSRPTVYKLIESGKLPAYKKGRSWQISADAVAAFTAQKQE